LVSPILVRPVREQLEHDRIIRLLHTKSRRKYDAGMNPGAEQNAPVSAGGATLFPDLVLSSVERGKKLQAVVEVETTESVNHLEALAQWAHFGRLRTAFHLYVPSGMVDVARRLAEDNQIQVTEIWSYHTVGDEVRFTIVHKSKEIPTTGLRAVARPAPVVVVTPPPAPPPAPVRRKAAPPPPPPPPPPRRPAARKAAPKRKPAKKSSHAAKRK
jgi:hypothetical protein